MFNC
jgi:hypothetical protein